MARFTKDAALLHAACALLHANAPFVEGRRRAAEEKAAETPFNDGYPAAQDRWYRKIPGLCVKERGKSFMNGPLLYGLIVKYGAIPNDPFEGEVVVLVRRIGEPHRLWIGSVEEYDFWEID